MWEAEFWTTVIILNEVFDGGRGLTSHLASVLQHVATDIPLITAY